MILDYIKFKKLPLSADIPLFLIHGNPRNISNEIEYDICSFYKKLGYKHENYVIDDDSETENIRNNLNEQSLFNEKKILSINIVSKSIPVNMKKLIDHWASEISEDKLIIKLDRQASSFKRTNFYKNLSNSGCVIEIYELKGKILEHWVMNKYKINNLEFSNDSIRDVINSNLNNSLSISQHIYLQGINRNNKLLSNSSKHSEYDLIDMILTKDIEGFERVSSYLKNIDAPLTYIIFLINTELEKLYSLAKPITSKPYIPTFLQEKYLTASRAYTSDNLLNALKKIAELDINSKYGSKKSNPWVNFNSLLLNLMKAA